MPPPRSHAAWWLQLGVLPWLLLGRASGSSAQHDGRCRVAVAAAALVVAAAVH
jgi:hypothetical protein